MPRVTGSYRETIAGAETVRAFVPNSLPPSNPPLLIKGELAEQHAAAIAALGRFEVAGAMVPSANWFLYGFTRKEALVSSQIEGTQATLVDVVTYEATREAERPGDVKDVCNYVDALSFARAQVAAPDGLPISKRLLCEAHARLMQGTMGGERQPGQVRTSQNWIGGARPGNAVFVPPPPDAVPDALTELERWIHGDDPLPPLVRAGVAHVQFETIHPFLDGNGRIGRMLITLLVEHWDILPSPLLYLSLAFRRHQQEYYNRLGAVRTEGDWEGWTAFFLRCVREAAEDGVDTARRLFALLEGDRRRVIHHPTATIPTAQLFDMLPEHPIVTVSTATELTGTSKPTAMKAVRALRDVGVLDEITGKQRGRVYAYQDYLSLLSEDTGAAERVEDEAARPSEMGHRADERLQDAIRRLAGGDDAD